MTQTTPPNCSCLYPRPQTLSWPLKYTGRTTTRLPGPAVSQRSSKNRWVRDSSEFSRLTALGTVREGDETWPGDRHLLPLKSTGGNYCHQHAQPSLSRSRTWQSPGSLLELQRPNLHFNKTQGDSFTRSLKPGRHSCKCLGLRLVAPWNHPGNVSNPDAWDARPEADLSGLTLGLDVESCKSCPATLTAEGWEHCSVSSPAPSGGCGPAHGKANVGQEYPLGNVQGGT